MIPHEIRGTLAEMEAAGLKDSPQYARLKELVRLHTWNAPTTTREQTLTRLDAISEIHAHLRTCRQMILDARMIGLFKPYLATERVAGRDEADRAG